MKSATLKTPIFLNSLTASNYLSYLLAFFTGLLGPLGFAPFHLPGMTILSLVSFYFILTHYPGKKSFLLGLFYGVAYFGFGISWVIISIHDYGNLNYVFSGIATLAFIFYLSLFPALASYLFKRLIIPHSKLKKCFII